MQLIALTGGIASGKSTIGKRLEQLGAIRIDADQLARDAVEVGSPGLERVTQRFGSDVLTEEGELDRGALGELVFNDPVALTDLNAIVHPEVRRIATERVRDAERLHPDGIVVYEIPLFVETRAGDESSGFAWDLVVVADAPADVRVRRLVELRNMSEAEARRRIANQASDDERRAVADVLIDTSASEEYTLEQVDGLWERLTAAP